MEIWKDIVGFEGLYEVSSLGNVRNSKTSAIRKLSKDRYGYLKVHLRKCGKDYYVWVARAVAIAFIDNPDGLPQVNHKDENKENNSIENLEWCTAKYNSNYGTARERGNKKISVEERCRLSTLETSKPVAQYDVIGNFIKEYKSSLDAERMTKINGSGIRACCIGRQKTAGGYVWRHK